MNILVVSQYFWPENFRINELVADLVERGHRVTVLTGLPNYPDGRVFAEYCRDPQAFAAYRGAKVVRAPMIPRGRGHICLMLNYLSFVVSACLIGAWRLRREPFDVILTFEPSPIFVGIPSAWMRWLKGAPQAFWVLDLWPETLKAVGAVKSKVLLAFVGCAVRWIYRRCDLILAQSKSFVRHIARYAPPGAAVEYLPSWADDVFAGTGSAVAAPEVPRDPTAFTVLFAGNIGEAQDFPAILDAASSLRQRHDIRWVIVGDGRMLDWVVTEIERRFLHKNVLLVGRHPLDRMPSFFAHADALLVSLKSDPIFAMTIPGKMQAYFGAGLPLLAMLDGEGAHIVAEADAGLVCPAGDSAALAANVVTLVEYGPARRQRMGENGRRLCAEEFDRVMLMNRLEGLLQSLVEKEQSKGTDT